MAKYDSPADKLAPSIRRESDLRELERLKGKYEGEKRD